MNKGLYTGTNKDIIQKEYNRNNLIFEVLEVCSSGDSVELSELEEKYIEMFKDTICNQQKTVVWTSSNKNGASKYRRRKVNIGSKNPNCKYDEKTIKNIIWMKENGYTVKEISKYFTQIPYGYLYIIGDYAWLHLEGQEPEFLKNLDVEDQKVDFITSLAMLGFTLGVIGLVAMLGKIRRVGGNKYENNF